MHPKDQLYQIRPASLIDIDTLFQIEQLSFKEAYPKSLLIQMLQDQKAICLVLENAQTVIGFAIGLSTSRRIGHLVSLAIAPSYRHRHYGTVLLSHLMSEFKKRGITQIQLEVRVSNRIAQKLYSKFNFRIIDIKRHYYSNGEDAYFMMCRFHSKSVNLLE